MAPVYAVEDANGEQRVSLGAMRGKFVVNPHFARALGRVAPAQPASMTAIQPSLTPLALRFAAFFR